MLTIMPNEDLTGIQFLFRDFFTQEQQFITAFDLQCSLEIAEDIKQMVKEIQKGKKMDKQIRKIEKENKKEGKSLKKLEVMDKKHDKKLDKCDKMMMKKKK